MNPSDSKKNQVMLSLRLEREIAKQIRHRAIDDEVSVNEWIVAQLQKAIAQTDPKKVTGTITKDEKTK